MFVIKCFYTCVDVRFTENKSKIDDLRAVSKAAKAAGNLVFFAFFAKNGFDPLNNQIRSDFMLDLKSD